MPDAAPDIAVVIPNWNGRDLLPACLESVRRTRGELRLEIVVVDNASTDGGQDRVRAEFPEVEVLQNQRNEGFARACNQGAARTTAPAVLLLNSDARLQPDSMQRLLAVLRQRPRAAAVGPQLRNPDGSFQSAHTPFPNLWQDFLILTALGRLFHGPAYPSHPASEERGVQTADWLGGACLLVRREAWAAAGGLDEGYFMYAEELDLCYRLRRLGWEVWYEPSAVVVHLGGGSAEQIPAQTEARKYRSRIRFYRLHHGVLAAHALRALILAITAVKIPVHAALRRASGGRRGRAVVSLRLLCAELRGA